MPPTSPARPTRRVATRRKVLTESSDEEELDQSSVKPEPESEDDFTPAPKPSPRRQTRRKTTNVAPTTPRTATRTRRGRTGDQIDPPETFDPEQSIPPEPVSPTKKASPRKRKSVAVTKPRQSTIPETAPPLLTPKPSRSPEPSQLHATPLADITNATLNEQPPTPQSVKATPSLSKTQLQPEKPIDIVIRSRAAAVPEPKDPAPPASRIVITYLVLTNFKSYAGRQEVGPFHTSFSSVVGPNGSGKSNVIDSLLFVFGFRASKMRQGKISALIHNSAAFPNLENCEVEVHFQEVKDLVSASRTELHLRMLTEVKPDGKHEIVPDSTMVVSRKAFRNNASKYYINGSESNFTTVTTLLRERGIDLDHKRFLILQGEVESIAQMKPKAANEHDDGLLEYLEDIIGTSKYKSPIEESAAESEALNEVCLEKSTRVQHVEKEKNSLEDKKNKALAYIKDENELAVKQSALYQVYMDECGDNVKVTEEAIQQMTDQLNGELEKHQGNEDGIKVLQKTHKQGLKEFDQLEKETQAVLKEMAKYDKENVKFEEKKKFLLGKQKKLDKTAQSSRLAASAAASLVEKHGDDRERSAREITTLEKSMREEEKELNKIRQSLQGKTQAFSDQIAVKQTSLEPFQAKVNEKQSAIAVAQSELDILQERRNAGAVALQELQERIETTQTGRAEKVAQMKELEHQGEVNQQEIGKTQKELAKVAQKEPELRAQVSNATQKADEARASLSNTQTQGNVLTGLMRLKDSGRIDGFHGRLGNLGAIDQKYDVAISTACPSLDNMVVDSVEVGQQCIDYLRKNNLGRANFILLDRLAQRDLSPIDTPENVPRLFDVVKSKHDRFRPAFYSVLQNTLVAKDLPQANRIAYGAKRWRVVTLDGQLIDMSGTMSGGGTRVAKGGMSSKLVGETSREQVSKLEGDRDALEQNLKALQDRRRELEGRLKELENEIPHLQTKMQKLTLEVENSDRNLADIHRRIKDLKAEHQPSKSDDNRVAVLEKQVAGLEKEVAKIHTQMAGLEEEIKKLQDKIMEVGGVRLRSQKAKVDGLKGQIDTLNEEILSTEVSKAKEEKQHAKHEKASAEALAELETVSGQMEELTEEANRQQSVAAGSKQKGEEAQEALDAKKEELAALKAELDEKTAELNEIRAVEIEMRNKLEENQKVLSENQKRSRYWHDKLSKLAIQKISDLGEEEAAEDLPTYTKDELADMDKDTLKGEIAILEEKTQNVSVELGVLGEYRRRVEEHASRSADLDTAVTTRDTVKRRCDELRQLRLSGFMTGFSTISLRLKEMYQMITMGGNAELELVDSLDPFAEGILFSVMPPKKSWKNISNLSGGEKTLSSLALVFALHHYKPTPLYVMDEIDAALDFRNVSIVASYIKERTKNAQFIVISLRNNMFELASRLVGVYKVNHMTKSIAIENRDFITGRD
ncbi:MAG: hypothetical protein M1817_006747 [Caeruleum heppii]|nr:MAG: hypothetical protein M1817_006747 [Caeruleum heppii]